IVAAEHAKTYGRAPYADTPRCRFPWSPRRASAATSSHSLRTSADYRTRRARMIRKQATARLARRGGSHGRAEITCSVASRVRPSNGRNGCGRRMRDHSVVTTEWQREAGDSVRNDHGLVSGRARRQAEVRRQGREWPPGEVL